MCWPSIAPPYCKFCFQVFSLLLILVKELTACKVIIFTFHICLSLSFTSAYSVVVFFVLFYFVFTKFIYIYFYNSTFLCGFYICLYAEESLLSSEVRGSSLSLPSLKIVYFYTSLGSFFAINIF